jgi:hypothetical protein
MHKTEMRQQLRNAVIDAARELAQFEHIESFQLPVPNTQPPVFVTYGTKELIEAISSNEGWQRYGPDDVDEGTLNKRDANEDAR